MKVFEKKQGNVRKHLQSWRSRHSPRLLPPTIKQVGPGPPHTSPMCYPSTRDGLQPGFLLPANPVGAVAGVKTRTRLCPSLSLQFCALQCPGLELGATPYLTCPIYPQLRAAGVTGSCPSTLRAFLRTPKMLGRRRFAPNSIWPSASP